MRQPWIKSPWVDGIGILAPAFLSSMIVILGHVFFKMPTLVLNDWGWMILVLGIDVAHVHSTWCRTYFNVNEFSRDPFTYLAVPLLLWITGVILYSALGNLVFWRCMAYLAVFHFLRQQSGFLKIYTRKEKSNKNPLDSWLVSILMIIPLLLWHTHLPKQFNWFLEGDFISFARYGSQTLDYFFYFIYGLTIFTYAFFELRRIQMNREINWPKNLLLLGTGLSWFTGIIVFNSDFAFSITNVVSHGVPYFALIWIYQNHSKENKGFNFLSKLYGIFAYAVIFAFIEEAAWDTWIWSDHPRLFGWTKPLFGNQFKTIPAETLKWLVPLLALPQLTHYVLDGVIWKRKNATPSWKNSLA